MDGFVVLDKPAGMSSMQAVALVRRRFGVRKAGHGGTLDPLATGVLPIALGEATKVLPYILDSNKEYLFTVEFGRTTDTLDAEGKTTATADKIPTRAEIESALSAMTGEIMQAPPAFSAIKIGGQRAYALARSTRINDLDMDKRPVIVHNADLKDTGANSAVLSVRSGPGFYVRSFARDLARACGTVGFVAQLRRVKAGPFALDRAVRPEELRDGNLLEVKTALDDILELALTQSEAVKIRHGQKIPPREGAFGIVLLTLDGKAAAIGNADARCVAPIKVLNIKGET